MRLRALWTFVVATCAAAQCIVTIAGPISVEGSPATSQQLASVLSVASDGAGGWLVSDSGASTIRRISPNGTMTTVAGIPRCSSTPPCLNAQNNIASDGQGGAYIADTKNSQVRRLLSSGAVTLVAGNGSAGLPVDGLATQGRLNQPLGVSPDGAGGFWIADTGNHAVRFVSSAGVLSTVSSSAGVAGYAGDGGPASSALLNTPSSVQSGVGSASVAVWIADTANNAVRAVLLNGTMAAVAGNGSAAYSGDGGQATLAALNAPWGLAADGAGGVVVTDSGNNVVRRISVAGVISLLAGSPRLAGNTGNQGPATSAKLSSPRGIAGNGAGTYAFADFSNAVLKLISPAGFIFTIAGVANVGFSGSGGNGGPATSARMFTPWGLVLDSASNSLIITDKGNSAIRRLWLANLTMASTNVVGISSSSGNTGNGGAGSSARCNSPQDFSSDGAGGWLLADTGSNQIRRLFSNGTIVAVVGNGTASYSPDGLPGTQTAISAPCGVTPDPGNPGSFLFTDTSNFLLRYYNASTGTVSTLAGTAMVTGVTSSYASLPATSAVFSAARTVRPFGSGWLIADYGAHNVRIYWPNRTVQTLVGSNLGASGNVGDGGSGTLARLGQPFSTNSDGTGGYFIGDSGNNIVRRVFANGTVVTIAGTRQAGYTGDGRSPTSARLFTPSSAITDGVFTWISEYNNHAIRQVMPQASCVLPAASQLANCTPSSPSAATCVFVGLAQVPPLFAWLGGAVCNTTLHPTPASLGTARVSCPLASSYVVSSISWLTQMGSMSIPIAIGTPSQTSTASGSATPSETASPTRSPSVTGTVTASFSATLTTTPSLSMSPTGSSTASQVLTYSQTLTATQLMTVSQTLTRSASQLSSGSPSMSPTQAVSNSQTLTPSQTSLAAGSQAATQASVAMTFSPSPSPSGSPTKTQATTASGTATISMAPTMTQTLSTTQVRTASQSASPLSTALPTTSSTATASLSSTQTGSQGASISQSPSFGTSPSATRSPSQTATPSGTSSCSQAQSSSQDATGTSSGSPVPSPSQISSQAGTVSVSLTRSSSQLASSSRTVSQVATPSAVTAAPSQAASLSPAPALSSASQSQSGSPSRAVVATISGSQTESGPQPLSPTIGASTTQSNCISWGVPVTLSLTGGVKVAVVTSPSVGVLVRLGLACYLGIPVARVAITSVANETIAAIVASDDAVNVVTGACSSLSFRARALTRGMGSTAEQQRRVLAFSGASLTNVTLSAIVDACTVTADGTLGLSTQLSSLIAGLSNASSGAGASAPSTGPQLGSFLSAAANASGISLGAVSATASVGTPRSASVPAVGASGSPAQGSSTAAIAAGVTVAVLVVFALVALAAVVLVRHRKAAIVGAPPVSGTSGSGMLGDAGVIAGVNPMHSARGVGPSSS